MDRNEFLKAIAESTGYTNPDLLPKTWIDAINMTPKPAWPHFMDMVTKAATIHLGYAPKPAPKPAAFVSDPITDPFESGDNTYGDIPEPE